MIYYVPGLVYLISGISLLDYDVDVCSPWSSLSIFCIIFILFQFCFLCAYFLGYIPTCGDPLHPHAVVWLSFLIYETIVLYSPNGICPSMKKTYLYIWALVTFYLLVLALAGYIIYICWNHWKTKVKVDDDNKSEQIPLNSNDGDISP